MNININSGVQKITINDTAQGTSFDVMINPTDFNMMGKIATVFDSLDKRQIEYEAALKDTEDPMQIFEFIKARDKEMRVMIDDLFNGFKKHHTHIAIVRDKKQKVIGMVTMDDVLEELVSDISEPTQVKGRK